MPVVREMERTRARLEYTQRQMAAALDVPPSTYQKWLAGQQRPRHGQALLTRLRDLAGKRQPNCWEYHGCGREAAQEGRPICPAALAVHADGLNGGANGGRICWAIDGTLDACAKDHKPVACMRCDFFHAVLDSEGRARFKLLVPGEVYFQV